MIHDRFRPYNVLALLVLVTAMTCAATIRTDARGADGDEPGNSLNARFEVAARHACDERGFATCGIIQIEREQLTADIAHYTALLRVGSGPFDTLPIHRIVRERRPGVQTQTAGTFFFLHGSADDFLFTMLNAEKTEGIGRYLAERDVDVWGVDLRWVRVPPSQTDFSFMASWNYDLQVADVLLATRFARHARRLTGQHFGGLNLAGHSLGGSLAFAVANADAALPQENRDVAGLIPIDVIYIVPPDGAATRKLHCDTEVRQRANIARGVYSANSLAVIDQGRLALTDPTGLSPYAPALTNRQVALNNAAALSFQPALPFHTFSVLRDASGGPTDGRYTETTAIFEIDSVLIPYRALPTMADYFGIACGDAGPQHTAHLGDVTVPVLYVGFAGGMGHEGLYTTTLLGSQDVTTLMIQLLADAQAKDDFGHLDWFQAQNAAAVVWDPIWRWVASR